MRPEQLFELDRWIAERIMGYWRPIETKDIWKSPSNKVSMGVPHYSTSAADVMEVLKKCGEHTADLQSMYLGVVGDEWVMGHDNLQLEVAAPTLELCICLFAKQLFATDGPHGST
jgi:hypothetical protein